MNPHIPRIIHPISLCSSHNDSLDHSVPIPHLSSQRSPFCPRYCIDVTYVSPMSCSLSLKSLLLHRGSGRESESLQLSSTFPHIPRPTHTINPRSSHINSMGFPLPPTRTFLPSMAFAAACALAGAVPIAANACSVVPPIWHAATPERAQSVNARITRVLNKSLLTRRRRDYRTRRRQQLDDAPQDQTLAGAGGAREEDRVAVCVRGYGTLPKATVSSPSTTRLTIRRCSCESVCRGGGAAAAVLLEVDGVDAVACCSM